MVSAFCSLIIRVGKVIVVLSLFFFLVLVRLGSRVDYLTLLTAQPHQLL